MFVGMRPHLMKAYISLDREFASYAPARFHCVLMHADSSDFPSEEEAGTLLPSAPSIPNTAVAAREVDEETLRAGLNAVVYRSLAPLLVGLSGLCLIQMITYLALIDLSTAHDIALVAVGSAVGFGLLRMGLARIAPESERVYAVGGIAVIIVLGNTLGTQVLTGEVQIMPMALLLVGIGFVFLSTPWFIGALAASMLSWLAVTVAMHPPGALFFPVVNLCGTATLATVMHVVRRYTNRQAERLRRATEQQQEALGKALMIKERHRQSLVESQASLQEALGDLKETQEALESREQRLSQMVRELTDAKEQAEETSRLKSAMLANISHEVRTPLTSIMGFAEVMAEETGGKAKHFATLIYENSTRLLETLSSVLRLSKLEAGKESIRFEKMDIVDELAALSTEQSERADRAGVELQFEVGCDQCVCYLDPGAVQRVLRNLVGNAIKFTEAGGDVVVRMEPVTKPKATQASDEAFTHVRIEVEDTGEGISASFQDDMFKAFRQEEQTDRSGHKGSGLGLAITKQLVDLMEGEITVESEKGVGTRFTILLPRVPDGADETASDLQQVQRGQ